jgi:hypothetical protein
MPAMVFISHSSKGQATADAICSHLESAGIKCWIAPRDIAVGSDWTHWIGGVKALIHRLRKRYSDLLSEEVSRTVTNPGAIGEEVHSRCEAFIAAEGRSGP